MNVKSNISLRFWLCIENVEEFSEDERDSFTINWVVGRWDCERLGAAGQTEDDKEIEEVGGLDESIAIQVARAGVSHGSVPSEFPSTSLLLPSHGL